MLDVSKKVVEDITIFSISGEVDLYVAPELKDTIAKEISDGKLLFLFDFANVRYIDSSGIGVIFNTLVKLKKKGGAIKIFNVAGAVEKLFHVTGLYKAFEVFSNESEAVASFKK